LINGWCAQKTHGKIDEILSEISPNAVMYLINALYFKGVWQYQFDKTLTQNETFHNFDGTQTQVPMMNETISANYFANTQFEVVELPYGNGAFSMVVVLPKNGVSVDDVINSFTPDTWQTLLSSMNTVDKITVKLPRFKTEYKRKLNDDLKALGMTSMFSNANLSEINPDEDLYVSMVLQKTFAEVNEEGTEAAAVTVIGIETTSVPEPLVFEANRPFLYFIKERNTGAILFGGVNKSSIEG
jgi:serpin B